ncbi:MAG: DegT/DnrJ/EryC1/StrS family aminotransferase, partial [Acidimicrobiia bacterium]|nr:DegT/DnrJ/EryC1/StrS family aminotransferase [Acidimicrobiia bacterium]
PKHGLLSVEALTAFLENGCENRHGVPHNRATGRPVRGVISVDILGHPSDLTAISEVAARHGVAVIEDATESLGATIGGVRLGGIAPITAFSFNGNKLLTTGGGGMLTTNDDRIADRARYLTTQAKDDPIEYVHNEIGYNYRLTNLQAAVGVAQLERLDEFISSKLSIARRYRQAFEALPDLGLIEGPPWGNSMYWLATASLHPESKVSSRALLRLLESSNIQTRPLWQPLHRSPAHAGSWASPCPYAEDLAARSLSLPSSTHLSPDDQDRVIEAVVQALA